MWHALTEPSLGIESVEWSFRPWPVVSDRDVAGGDPAPGAISVVVRRGDGIAPVTVERWLDRGLPSLRSWPDCTGPAEPWVMWRRHSEVRLEVTAGVNTLGEDELLASALLDAKGTVTWMTAPPPDIPGAVAKGLIFGVGQAMRARPKELAEDSVFVDQSVGEHPHRSLHLAAGGRILRALEMAPIDDPKDDRVRARVACVVDDGLGFGTLGTLVTGDGGTRWWPVNASPLLDSPATGKDLPRFAEALAERLR